VKRLCGLFGHEKKYVGVEDIVWEGEYGLFERPCVHDEIGMKWCSVCGKSCQVARWVCSCGFMGETYIRIGAGMFKVEFGKLVPDEKRWANHTTFANIR
jgi:hypothetical protein